MSVPREESSTPDPVRAETVRSGTVEPAESEPRRPLLGKLVAILIALLCALYMANPGAGVFGEIPDNFPVIGNLDEATAMAILVSALAYLGIRLPFASSRDKKSRR